MEPEGSLPHSQASATCPYPGPAQSSPHTHIPPPGDPSYIIHLSTPRSPQCSLSLRFPHQDLIHPLSSPIPATASYTIFKNDQRIHRSAFCGPFRKFCISDHYTVHGIYKIVFVQKKRSSSFRIVSQINPVKTITRYWFQINFNNILTYRQVS